MLFELLLIKKMSADKTGSAPLSEMEKIIENEKARKIIAEHHIETNLVKPSAIENDSQIITKSQQSFLHL